jgi:hypothetical protein
VHKITPDLNDDVRDRVRSLANTEAFQQSRRERNKIEMRFAHMKRILRLDRLRLRGLAWCQRRGAAHSNGAAGQNIRLGPLNIGWSTSALERIADPCPSSQ